MLRVLIDASALPADRGGVGRYVDELLRRLPHLGGEPSLDVHVVAQPRDVELYAATLGRDHVHPVPAWAAGTPARLVWEQVGLPLVAHRVRPDVLHSPHYTMPLGVRALPGSRRPRMVVTVHDATFFSLPEVHTPVKRRFFTTWTRLSARLADALVVPSRATLDEVVEHTGVPAARVVVAPHGVDHERFRPPRDAEVDEVRAWLGLAAGGASYVAFLGTLEPRKNVPALVQAWVETCRDRDDPPALVLAGGPGWDDRLPAAVAAVPGHLTLLRPGFVPDGLVPALLGGAEVVGYPALGEGFGLPVLEAMACGAAVLTTRRLSLPEVGGDAVAYAESPDAADITLALAELLDDVDRRKSLSTLGIERAATYTWERCAAQHLRAYDAAGTDPGTSHG